MLDSQLKKLHQALEVMISARKGKCNLGHELLQLLSCFYFSVFFSELCTNTSTFVKSVATLGEYHPHLCQLHHTLLSSLPRP